MTTMIRPRRSAAALLAIAALVLALLPAGQADAVDDATDVWVNEFHYDNAGADEGEFVELAVAEGTDLTDWSLVRYNGNGGAPYDTTDLTGSTVENVTDGFGFVVDPGTLQNGSPDGFALVDDADVVVQFLSYEGTFEAVGGPADGLTSTDVGVEQPGSTPVGASIQLTGTGTTSDDFTWEATDDRSPGAINSGQSFGEGDPDPDPTPTPTPTPTPAPSCDVPDADLTLISEVQGDGSSTPLDGEQVTVEAVVTLVTPGLDGLFVQEEPGDHDSDDATSEGLFVYTGGNLLDDLAADDTVQVTGEASEFGGKTQVTSFDDVVVCDVDPVEIEPVELPLPLAPADREPYESMLVTASDLVVSGSFPAYQFGELITGYEGELHSATDVAEPGAPAEAAAAAADARELVLDDRSTGSIFGRSIWDDDPERRLGDEIPEVDGVLDFSFGDFKLQYTEFPEFELYGQPDAPDLAEGNDVGAFNVLNYFNEFGDSSRLRGARNQEQFEVQTQKIVDTILALDATVLGLVEVQNDYLDEFDGDDETEPSIATLVDAINEQAGEELYEYVRIPEDQLATTGINGGGAGTDAIANGIIYQPGKADQVGTGATFDIDEDLSGTDPEKNRWPVAASFDIDGEFVTVAVNHFKSKRSSCDDVAGPGFDEGDDTGGSGSVGNCNLTRQYAANKLVDWVDGDPTGADDDDVFLVGDFNSYREEAPIQILEDAGYVDTAAEHDEGAFTYKFSGRVGTLDYVFASEDAAEKVDDAEVWQTNSRASYLDLYYIGPNYEEGPKGSSDHDPVVASLLAADEPMTKADCKGGGWESFEDPSFRNQGLCVSYVESGELRGDGPPAHAGRPDAVPPQAGPRGRR